MSRKQVSIAEQLQKAIAKAERGGLSQYRIAKQAGMAQAQLARVASGETCPTLHTAERIALAIGCRLAIVSIVAK
jgi:DNA-binding phage protein